MHNFNQNQLPDVNALLLEKLASFPIEVRSLALKAIQLSESFPEVAVADQLQAIIRKLIKRTNEDSK